MLWIYRKSGWALGAASSGRGLLVLPPFGTGLFVASFWLLMDL